jgi:cytosine/adenosine deaminase-related metal-dependent hydrolase
LLELVLVGARLPDGRVADIGCHGGRIVEIGALTGRAAGSTVLCEGRAVIPGTVDPHIHLAKGPLDGRASDARGPVAVASARPLAPRRCRAKRAPGHLAAKAGPVTIEPARSVAGTWRP